MKYEDCVVGLLLRRNRRCSDHTSMGSVSKQPDTRPIGYFFARYCPTLRNHLYYLSSNFCELFSFKPFKYTNSNITVLIFVPIKRNKCQRGWSVLFDEAWAMAPASFGSCNWSCSMTASTGLPGGLLPTQSKNLLKLLCVDTASSSCLTLILLIKWVDFWPTESRCFSNNTECSVLLAYWLPPNKGKIK